jgi:hypothetical protein
MPVVYVTGFKTSVKPVWEWDDTDDAGLIAFMQAGRSATCNNFTVVRDDVPVLLRWQKYQYTSGGYSPTGVYSTLPLNVGDRIDPTCPYPYPLTAAPGVRDMTGIWVSDQFGRPFDVNDMAAQ